KARIPSGWRGNTVICWAKWTTAKLLCLPAMPRGKGVRWWIPACLFWIRGLQMPTLCDAPPGGLPKSITFQRKPQLAAAMVRVLYNEGVLAFRYMVAGCLYGNSPALWAACDARAGTVAFVAILADTCAWHAPVVTHHRTYCYRGEER